MSHGVRYVPVADASVIEGKRAAAAIPAGSLLTTGDLATAPAVARRRCRRRRGAEGRPVSCRGPAPGEQVLVVQTGTPGSPLSAPVPELVRPERRRRSSGTSGSALVGTGAGRAGPGGDRGVGRRRRHRRRAAATRSSCRSRCRPPSPPVVATAASAGQVSLVLLPAHRHRHGHGHGHDSGRGAAMTLVGVFSLKGAPGVTTLSCLLAATVARMTVR